MSQQMTIKELTEILVFLRSKLESMQSSVPHKKTDALFSDADNAI
jgi:hypothetical protein